MDWLDRLRGLKDKTGLSIKAVAEISDVPEATLEKLFSGQTKNPGINTVRQVVHALGYSLNDIDGVAADIKKAPSLSDEALEIARGYEDLDHWGKVAVRELLDTERQRVEDDRQFRLDTLLEAEPKVINLYTEPSAAGIATPTAGVDFQPYELKPGDPQDAAYAVYIQGDSMEPAFPDGSVVFINHDAIRNGDIGIFCVNGGTVCKQYYRDPMGGIVNLFSLNRKRADADVAIYPGSNETLICQGRVITKKKFPLPEGHM